MSDTRYVVMVDTWGNSPALERGMAITIGHDKGQQVLVVGGRRLPFEHDVEHAIAQGTLVAAETVDDGRGARDDQALLVAMGAAPAAVHSSVLPIGDEAGPTDVTRPDPELMVELEPEPSPAARRSHKD